MQDYGNKGICRAKTLAAQEHTKTEGAAQEHTRTEGAAQGDTNRPTQTEEMDGESKSAPLTPLKDIELGAEVSSTEKTPKSETSEIKRKIRKAKAT